LERFLWIIDIAFFEWLLSRFGMFAGIRNLLHKRTQTI